MYVEVTVLNPIGVMPNGKIQTLKPDLCIPQSLMCKIFQLKAQGKSLADTIDILRQTTVPRGFPIHTWTEGKYGTYYLTPVSINSIAGLTEAPDDELRSILAQAHFTQTVVKLDREGLPFSSHCYVPEEDPVTGKVFH